MFWIIVTAVLVVVLLAVVLYGLTGAVMRRHERADMQPSTSENGIW